MIGRLGGGSAGNSKLDGIGKVKVTGTDSHSP